MAAGPSLPSEMISGPDLGAGYLHQLSFDRHDAATTFTHHAQEGGRDAAGPPVGPLDVLGFARPPSPCMFGGPGCWHRRYLLPFSATAKVRFAYQRHRFVLDTMLRQAHGLADVEFDDALNELVRRVAGPLRDERIEWYVAGSGSVRLVGGGGSPRDIDLGTTRKGVERLGELLAEYLVEPVAPTDRPGGDLVLGGRAFVGTPRSGARVEWAVPLDRREPLRWEELGGVAGVARTLEVSSPNGDPIRVSRPEYALVRAASRGRTAGTEAAIAAIRHVGADPELLAVLLDRSPLPLPARVTLRGRVLGGA